MVRLTLARKRSLVNDAAQGDEVGADMAQRFRRGDADAVRAVYRAYAGSVTAVATAIMPTHDGAAEVVQQTFVKAWRASHRFDPSRDMGPWLRTIARRTAIDAMKASARRPTAALSDVAEPAAPDVAYDAGLLAGEVRDALDNLPDDEREVVRLAYLVGLTHTEIASRLEIPVGTVKSRSNRAHRRLAQELRGLREEVAP